MVYRPTATISAAGISITPQNPISILSQGRLSLARLLHRSAKRQTKPSETKKANRARGSFAPVSTFADLTCYPVLREAIYTGKRQNDAARHDRPFISIEGLPLTEHG
jgi:hypothetical protein